MLKDRSKLTTEKSNPRSRGIDRRSAAQIVAIINAEDRKVAAAVGGQKAAMTAAVEAIVESFRRGGRLFYVGAGSSGRLGVLDASECPPTYGVPPTMVQGIIAGGPRALVKSVEGAEDHAEDGAAAIARRRVRDKDVVVGIAACGLTPFVRGALAAASKAGAKTVLVTCAPEARRCIGADILINPVVGPEVVTGSTRMKAGTATKLVLNTLTTAAMIRMGKVYDNLMVDLKVTNAKLRDRALRMIQSVAGLSPAPAAKLLDQAGGQVKPALLMHRRKITLDQARALLNHAGGSLRQAMG